MRRVSRRSQQRPKSLVKCWDGGNNLTNVKCIRIVWFAITTAHSPHIQLNTEMDANIFHIPKPFAHKHILFQTYIRTPNSSTHKHTRIYTHIHVYIQHTPTDANIYTLIIYTKMQH